MTPPVRPHFPPPKEAWFDSEAQYEEFLRLAKDQYARDRLAAIEQGRLEYAGWLCRMSNFKVWNRWCQYR